MWEILVICEKKLMLVFFPYYGSGFCKRFKNKIFELCAIRLPRFCLANSE